MSKSCVHFERQLKMPSVEGLTGTECESSMAGKRDGNRNAVPREINLTLFRNNTTPVIKSPWIQCLDNQLCPFSTAVSSVLDVNANAIEGEHSCSSETYLSANTQASGSRSRFIQPE